MKFNWGTGIVLSILCFMGFILFFFIKTTRNQEYNHELVTENYYEKELEYQNNINIENNTRNQAMQVAIYHQNNQGIQLTFPEKTKQKELSGVVRFYRPSNEKLDFEMPIKTQNAVMHIPDEKLVKGRWNISVEYYIENNKYITSFKITY